MFLHQRSRLSARVAPSTPSLASLTSSRVWLSRNFLLLVVAELAIQSCGGKSEGPSSPVPVASVRIRPDSATIALGGNLSLAAEALDVSGKILSGRPIEWKSSDSLTARISASGVVSGVQEGTATIQATSEGRTGVARLVVQRPVATVISSRPIVLLTVGQVDTLLLEVRDSRGVPLNGRATSWTSAHPTIATVTSGGVVSGMAMGETTVTANVEGISANILVHVVFATTRVDLSASQSVRSMNGLLHGLNLTNHPKPPLDRSTQLAPVIWRQSYTPDLAELNATGARLEYLLAGRWGFAVDNWPRGKPWEQRDSFAAMLISATQTLPRTPGMVWEVWNEPDPFFNRDFWDGTEQQFFETYLLAYRTLRSQLGPSALIGGPSIGTFDFGYLKRFADFCLAQGCEVNVLIWHELGYFRPHNTIAERLRRVREEIVNNPTYAALRIQEIHINEAVGPLETYNPTASLLYNQYLEIGGADGAARACWADSTSGQTNCYNNSLDGLISPTTSAPRGVWWAYKVYADGVQNRAPSVVSSPHLLSLASRQGGAGTPELLVGYSDVTNAQLPAPSLGISIEGLEALPSLRDARRLIVDVLEIPHTGEQELAEPRMLPPLTADVAGGRAVLVLPAARHHSVYVLRLRPSS